MDKLVLRSEGLLGLVLGVDEDEEGALLLCCTLLLVLRLRLSLLPPSLLSLSRPLPLSPRSLAVSGGRLPLPLPLILPLLLMLLLLLLVVRFSWTLLRLLFSFLLLLLAAKFL